MRLKKQKSVKFPIRHSSSVGKKFTKAALYGSGDMAIIFSNLDTIDQNEWNTIINKLISNR
ncbi:MAG: hypothetical protein GY874_06715 [Desulfobacteraceae bacterium]|nr:hypothetical protein [Desulfobacteraceae bacterium]